MSRCPTCGSLVREAMHRTHLKQMRTLAADLKARGHRFDFDVRRTEDGQLVATLNDKPMIGVRSPAAARTMAEAMTRNLRDGIALTDPVPDGS